MVDLMLTYLEQLDHKARQRGITLTQAMAWADIPYSTYYRALREGRDVSHKVASKVWEKLDCQKIPNSVLSQGTQDCSNNSPTGENSSV